MPPRLNQFLKALAERLPASKPRVEEPRNPDGAYWLDIKVGRRTHTLEFRESQGFGLHDPDGTYGERPAEVYRDPLRAVRRIVQLARADRMIRGMGLKDLRELYGQSQVDLAVRAGVKQPAISRFENRGEVKLSTLKAAIEALGGTLEVRAHFPDADVPLTITKE